METRQVLDTNIIMESKSGLTTILNVVEYPKAINHDFDILWPEKEDFIMAVEMMSILYAQGKPIPAMDVILAGMCLNRGLELRTKDRHFLNIKNIRPDFKLSLIKN